VLNDCLLLLVKVIFVITVFFLFFSFMCFLPTILVNKDDHIKCTNSLVLVLRHFAAVLAPGYTLLRGGHFAFKKARQVLMF